MTPVSFPILDNSKSNHKACTHSSSRMIKSIFIDSSQKELSLEAGSVMMDLVKTEKEVTKSVSLSLSDPLPGLLIDKLLQFLKLPIFFPSTPFRSL